MKISDIMIGDWVDVRNSADKNTPHIERITPAHLLRDEPCLGIPITPEILEKNGFSLLAQNRTYKVFTLREEDKLSIQVDFFGKDSRIIVRIEKYNYESKYYMNCLHNCDIKYVHQLQQAMRLCGISMEIEL